MDIPINFKLNKKNMSKILYLKLLKRLRNRLNFIRKRRRNVQEQIQHSFDLFQKSILQLFQTLIKQTLKIICISSGCLNNFKFKTLESNLCNTVTCKHENIINQDHETFEDIWNLYHVTPKVLRAVCKRWEGSLYFQKLVKNFIYIIANGAQPEKFRTISCSTDFLKHEKTISSIIHKDFGYTCSLMTMNECKIAKSKFYSKFGISISGILVDFKIGSENDNSIRCFGIVDHENRFLNITSKNCSCFAKDIEHYYSESKIKFFNDICDLDNKTSTLINAENIGVVLRTQLKNFKIQAIKELFERWKYLTCRQHYSIDLFRVCVILHNMCQNENTLILREFIN